MYYIFLKPFNRFFLDGWPWGLRKALEVFTTEAVQDPEHCRSDRKNLTFYQQKFGLDTYVLPGARSVVCQNVTHQDTSFLFVKNRFRVRIWFTKNLLSNGSERPYKKWRHFHIAVALLFLFYSNLYVRKVDFFCKCDFCITLDVFLTISSSQ